MKKLAFLLLFLFLLTGCACAQEALPEAVVSLLDAEYPSHQVLCRDVWGPTAAAVIQHNGKQVLCIAEDDNGDWRCTAPRRLNRISPFPSFYWIPTIRSFGVMPPMTTAVHSAHAKRKGAGTAAMLSAPNPTAMET